jgi:hypothetical protein
MSSSYPMYALIILGILLCTRTRDDLWAWNFDRKGLFSVCVAYRNDKVFLFKKNMWSLKKLPPWRNVYVLKS